MTRLWQWNLLFCGAAMLIIVFNWVLSGPPPALGDPASYLTYGRFKQVLFPLLVVVTVNSMLDSSRWRKALFAMFGIAGMALYITRGLLMVALLQMLFVFSLKTRMSKKKLYTIAVCCLGLAVVAITVIGNARTAQGVFLEYLQIRHKYSDWPMAYLWLTSYISIPFSNLVLAVCEGQFSRADAVVSVSAAAFVSDAGRSACLIHDDLSIIDGASTYLAAYALDFSYLGMYLANLVLGIGCGWLMERALPKNILVAGIFLTCLTFIFFSDMFTPLSTILQFAIQARCSGSAFSGAAHRRKAWCRNERREASISWSRGAADSDGRDCAVSDGACAVAGVSERDGCTCEIELGRGRCARAAVGQQPGAGAAERPAGGRRLLSQMKAIRVWRRPTTGLWSGHSSKRSEWLLTLDQDTAVPDDFFVKMAAAARASTRYAGIGAIVPQIAAGGRQLSPNYFQFGAIPRWYRTGYVGVPREPVFAFNSGAMLRVAALQQVGGYDPRFWLDDSDAMIFSKLHEHGKRVYVAGDIQVEHEFSMKDMQQTDESRRATGMRCLRKRPSGICG